MAALVLVGVLSGCQKGPEQTATPVIRPVKIFTVDALGANAKRSFPGVVEATDRAELAFRVAGELIKLPAKAGMQVKKGDLLAQLDPADFKIVLDDRQAQYDLAKVQFERAQELVDKKVLSQADYDKTKARYLATESELKAAQSNLDYTNLRAPYDGVVSRVLVDNRQNVQAKQAILNFQAADTVDVVFQVPESIVIRAKRGAGKDAPPMVRFDAKPELEFKAPIREFDTEADPKTQTYRAVASMPRPKDFPVLSGMTATVEIDLSKVTTMDMDKIYVPVESVFVEDEKPAAESKRYVWKIDPDTMTVSRHEISVGNLTGQGLEITDGLDGGDQIAAAGVHFLHEGQKIKRWERERGL